MSSVWSALVVTHQGINPARPDVVGEVVFSERWALLMHRRPSWADPSDEEPALQGVLGDLGAPDQRDATVAATFVQWLGTNVGSAFLDRAARLRELPWAARNGIGPHMLAWAECNVRRTEVNGGMRAIESILTPAATPRCRLGLPVKVADVSLRDLEVVERVANWLDSADGLGFLDGVIKELDRRHDAELERRRGPGPR